MAKESKGKPTPHSGVPPTHRHPMGEEVSTPTGGNQPPSSEGIPHRTDKAYSSFLPSPVESTGE